MDEYQLYNEVPLADRLIIGETNKCSICGKDFKYRFLRWRFLNTPEGLYEIKMKTEHPECLSLVRKIEKLKSEVVELEYELFRKKDLIY
jgi:hypothetical protein